MHETQFNETLDVASCRLLYKWPFRRFPLLHPVTGSDRKMVNYVKVKQKISRVKSVAIDTNVSDINKRLINICIGISPIPVNFIQYSDNGIYPFVINYTFYFNRRDM